MKELITNIHIHTVYSDGHGSHTDIARAGIKAGLDAVIITDHNILVEGIEGYFQEDSKRILVIIGEEIHDQTRAPQKNHLLVLGAGRELATFATDPQQLIGQVQRAEGLSFLAHPFESSLPLFGEEDITWVTWDVHGFTGIELWNGLSELKAVIRSRLHAIFYAFFPHFIAHGPEQETLRKWDELLAQGEPVVAIGSSDAHQLKIRLGPLCKTIFPYTFHFQTVNTHVLVPDPLSGNPLPDRMMILNALRQGHAFIGYDLPASTRGFRFTAQGKEQNCIQGDEIRLDTGITLQARLPEKCVCLLIKDGQVIQTWNNRDVCTYIATEPGIYRIECYLQYLGKRRGWIFSNPIYIHS